MLRISKMADYGTVVMVYLAKADRLSNVSEIAQATHLAKPTVSKLVKRLLHARLLMSERGAKGGYRLSRSASDISVADVIEAIEDRKGLTECVDNHVLCSLVTQCQVSRHWQQIDRAVAELLRSFTLTKLMQPASKGARHALQTNVEMGEVCEQ